MALPKYMVVVTSTPDKGWLASVVNTEEEKVEDEYYEADFPDFELKAQLKAAEMLAEA